MTITTKRQAKAAADRIADLLWAEHIAGTLTFEQTETLVTPCIDRVFDTDATPEDAVAAVVAGAR